MPTATGRPLATRVSSIARIDGEVTRRTPIVRLAPGARAKLVGVFHCSPAVFQSCSAKPLLATVQS
jgi:hypothetical protein